MFTPIVFALFLLLAILFFTAIGLFYLLFMGLIHYMPLLIIGVATLYVWIVMMIFHFFSTKRRKVWFGGIAAVVLLGASVWPIAHAYKNSISTVDAEVDVYYYEPFSEGSKLAELDEPATLQLEGELPRVDGATALYPLYAAFVQAVYPEKEYNSYDSEVMVNTTPIAYDNLFSGEVDLIVAAGPSDAQLKAAEQKGLKLELTPIGREAFVFFVNDKNPIDSLELKQIQEIYTGNITNWQEVGGNNEKIRAFQRPADSGSQTALERLMGDIPIMDAPKENVPEGMGGIISEVSKYRNYKNAIGYTFRYYSTEMVGNDEIKLLAINGVEPTKETIRNDEYPIASEFYAITAGTNNPNVGKFIEWMISSQGQALVEKTGYVPVEK
ncbi:substrate-binding domain-containing protein [Sporosarcina sp. GW1-11]|uniref:PstS family phosphate ABC transporter substrate-binding protein n=1 Tax=Sporosarcina sp. GW1-11 TaxID=2899126 RepID=UPI00294D596F|nr:substrate-binding domain-containing protein [Sporosarcina sp. GW1-11]MDV6379358.1 substrate-binding domain-containing protein [Sporosarcina sp. GW1-11]